MFAAKIIQQIDVHLKGTIVIKIMMDSSFSLYYSSWSISSSMWLR